MTSAWRETNRQFRSKQSEIGGIAAALAVPIAPELAAGNRRNIAVALNAIGRIKSVEYARVLSKDGQLVYELGSGILVSRQGSSSLVRTSFGPLDAIYFGSFPFRTDIVHRGQRIGTLELIVDLSDLRGALWDSIGQAFFFGLIAALFGVIASNYFQRRIAEPIVSLTNAMQHVQSEHDFNFRAVRTSDDETGELVDAFNAMLGEIQNRDRDLEEHLDQLEITVKERTADAVLAKEEADKANASKSQFLATMSHEIRTPLNGMLATAELLSSAGLPAKQQRHAEIILRSGKGLLTIINDILDLSKVDAGKLEFEAIPVDPAILVDDATQLFWERAREKGLDLCAYVAPDVPSTVLIDPVRISQILANLINNALKFTQSGHVLVRVEVEEIDQRNSSSQQLKLSVEDTGIGIADDKLDKVFDAFVQADSSISRTHGGTGIGLAICERLAQAMGGALTVESADGCGSVFTLCLPIEAVPDSVRQEACANSENNEVVVILEPGATRDTLTSYLQNAGFVVSAFDQFKSQPAWSRSPYCIFASNEICPEIIKLSKLEQPKVLVSIVATGSSDSIQTSRPWGAYAEILRPLSLSTLHPLIQAIAESPQSVEQLSNETASIAPTKYKRFDGVRVLAADDNAVNLEILSEALERLGVETACVEDGSKAVEIFQRQSFDLVFMDVSMPFLDGYGATAEIRRFEELGQLHKTPVVALTAHAYGSDANRWQEAGMDACVTKPFTLGSLQDVLSNLLTEHYTSDAAGASSVNRIGQSGSSSDAPITATRQALVDARVLDGIAEMQRNGDNLVGRIVGLYSQHAPKALQHLLELSDDADSDAVAAAAHALKSLSRNVGALAVGDLCDEIESAARRGETSLTANIRQELKTTLQSTLEALLKQSSDRSVDNVSPSATSA